MPRASTPCSPSWRWQAGQVGAALALYSRAGKDSLLRTQVKGTIIPGILGVGEPLIYGVTLPRVKPFITACCGGALGGFLVGLISWLGLPVGLNTVFGPSGIVALPLMTSAQGSSPACWSTPPASPSPTSAATSSP